MVDVDLFKDEEDEEKNDKHEEVTPDESGEEEAADILDGELEEELDFDEELSEELGGEDEDFLTDDDMLLEDDEVSLEEELDEPEAAESEENYQTLPGQKKTSPFIWVLLGVVVIGTALYLFVLEPRGNKETQSVTAVRRSGLTQPSAREGVAANAGDTTKMPSSAVKDDTALSSDSLPAKSPEDHATTPAVAEKGTGESETAPEPFRKEGLGNIATYSSAIGRVVSDLTGTDQFGGMFISGKNFFLV